MAARLLEAKYTKLSGTNAKHLPKPFKLRRYYLPSEVASHNTPTDCWLSFFNQVYDMSKVIQDNYGALVEPIIQFAGADITHWFDSNTKQPKRFVDPVSNLEGYYTPQGRYLHIPPVEPDAEFDNEFSTPWWEDKNLCIGKLTEKVRKIRIINMLTKHDDIIEVGREETINEILDRYLELNEHAASYTWKRLGRTLDMDSTLAQNDIPDETEEFVHLNIDEDEYVPAIHLYFNDDLTVA